MVAELSKEYSEVFNILNPNRAATEKAFFGPSDRLLRKYGTVAKVPLPLKLLTRRFCACTVNLTLNQIFFGDKNHASLAYFVDKHKTSLDGNYGDCKLILQEAVHLFGKQLHFIVFIFYVELVYVEFNNKLICSHAV